MEEKERLEQDVKRGLVKELYRRGLLDGAEYARLLERYRTPPEPGEGAWE